MSESSMSDVAQRLATEFADPDYRHGYAGDFLNTYVAAQIRALREQRGWTQAELAERAQMKQSRISAMEDVNYSSWSVRTLARLAEAFDVALAVCFKSFSARIGDIDRFSSDALLVPSYLDDMLISFGVGTPPKISGASPLVPIRARLIHAFAEFLAEPTPDGVRKTQQYADQLIRLAQRIYRNTAREYRDHVDWVTKLLNAVVRIAQSRIPSKEQQEQIAARIKELQAENERLAKDTEQRIRELEAQREQHIAAIELERQQRIAAIQEAARRETDWIGIFRDAILTTLAGERERIQLAMTTAKSDLSVEQFLREIEESLNRVGEVAQAA